MQILWTNLHLRIKQADLYLQLSSSLKANVGIFGYFNRMIKEFRRQVILIILKPTAQFLKCQQ